MENIFRIELNLFGLFISAIVLWIFYHQIKDRHAIPESRIFLALVYFTMVELILDSIFWLVDCRRFYGAISLNWGVNTLYYFFQIVQCYTWTLYCRKHLNCGNVKWKQYLMAIPLIAGVLLLVVNLWTGCVFYVDDLNIYHRTWKLWGSMEAILCMLYPVYNIVLTIVRMLPGEKQRKKEAGYLLLVSLIPVISAIIQMMVYGLNFIWVGMAMAMLLVLVEVELRQYQQMESELTEQRVQIMLSQIQPHFLYNSLTSIAWLCEEDPVQAKKATIEFAHYLRVNLDSIKLKRPVPFEKEIEHIRVYLSLEKMRFQEDLNIVYHIEATGFLLPALSIQPMVENAVKYGVGQKEDGGTVQVSSREEADFFVVQIEDDGVGFDPYEKQFDGRSHIGIDNVKKRLEEMVNGTLDIESTPGKGTVVTVRIPK